MSNFNDFLAMQAAKLNMTREEYTSYYLSEAKPGPKPYHRGLDDNEIEDKKDQIKKQSDMDDDDSDAYKEMPGDKEARKKGEVKTSKHVKKYHELYGDKKDESVDEATFRPNSGTMSGGTYNLDNRKYELKKDVEGVQIGDYTNIVLPKGTIIYNIPGGVFADHSSLKRYENRNNKYFNKSTFKGISIIRKKETIFSIDKNSKILESVVNEEKIKYAKGKTYQSSGHWTVQVDSNSSMCDIRVNHSAGWRLDPHDDREETWELLDNGRQRATINFRRGNIDKFAQQMFDLNDRTTWGNKTKLTAKDYADIIRVWIDMRKANESLVTERKTISSSKISMMGAKILRKISIGTIFDTEDGEYEITDYGQQANAFKEFEAEHNGKKVKVKLTAMYGVKFEVTDDVRSARFNKEVRLNSIILESAVTEGMSKSAIKKAIKVIDQQIEDEVGGDGEPLDNETLQALEQERERLLGMNESKFSPKGYAKRVVDGTIKIKDAMKEAGISLGNMAKLIAKIDKSFDVNAAFLEKNVMQNDPEKYVESRKNLKFVKHLHESFINDKDISDWEKEHGNLPIPKKIIDISKNMAKEGFIRKATKSVQAKLWIALEGKSWMEMKDQFGDIVGTFYGSTFYTQMTDTMSERAAYYAYSVSMGISDKIANDEEIEPAYYEMKSYFNAFGMDYGRSRLFDRAVSELESWMKKQKITTL